MPTIDTSREMSCALCAYHGDFSPKNLQKSHVIPRSFYMDLFSANGPALKNRVIALSEDLDENLHVTQDQGGRPMLCLDCEKMLNQQIDGPIIKWLRSDTDVIDSTLIARFIASIWWRGMLSSHHIYADIKFSETLFRSLVNASINSQNTFKIANFRIQKVTGFSSTSLQNVVLIKSNPEDPCAFSFIAKGYLWEAFCPPESTLKFRQNGGLSPNRKRYALKSYDLSQDPALIRLGVASLHKIETGKTSPTFRNYATSKNAAD